MKFLVIENAGSQYFYSIDQAAKMLGVSRRAVFDLLKKVKIEPLDKRQDKQKSFYSEDVLGRLWALHQRIGRIGNPGQTGVVEKPLPEKGGPSNRPIEPDSKPLSAEQKQAAAQRVAEILAKA